MFKSQAPQRKMVVAKSGPDNVEVDETLNALERARHFGNSKLSLQRLVYVNELVDCAHEIGYEATVNHLLPLVKKLASDTEVLVRQSLLGHFGDVAGFLIQADPDRGYQTVVDDLLPLVSGLLTERQGEVRQGAAEALTTLASHLRPGERGDQVLKTVIPLSHNNEDEEARSTAVQLLNGLAEALGQDLCRQFVGVELVALCEDPALRVRKATASNFAEVASVVGDEYALRRLVPAFKSLVSDVHWGVRKAAAESLVHLAMSLKAENRQEPFVPLMTALLGDNSRWVRMSAQQQLGYFIACLEAAERVPPTLLAQYVEIVQQAKANPDAADISYHTAYTFAAVAKTMGRAHWASLQVHFAALCEDPQWKTRKAMAASAHIVAQAIGPELTETEVLPHFEVLMQDSENDVRLAALRNVASVLRAAPHDAAQRSIARALQCTMAGKIENWRARHLVAAQLGAICEALGALPGYSAASAMPEGGPQDQPAHAKDIIWKVVVPLFLKLCSDEVAEVRDEAARSTARVLRAACSEMFADPGACGTGEGSGCYTLQRLPPQTTCLVRNIKSYSTGRCFRMRMTYIRMCDSIIRETPIQIFTDIFLGRLADLAKYRVKNVRLCWAVSMMPHIRKAGRLGQNAVLVSAARRMAVDDADEEVRRVLGSAQFADLPDPEDERCGTEGEESDKNEGEHLLATEGGTGDVSEHSDVGVEEPEEEFIEASSSSAAPPVAAAPALAPHNVQVGDVRGVSSEEPPFQPPVRQVSPPAALSTESPPTSPGSLGVPAPGPPISPASLSPARQVSPTLRPAMPRSPQQRPAELISPTAAAGHDLLEDSLVEQCEIDRDMDRCFADRRLLQETSAEELEIEAHKRLPGDAPVAQSSTAAVSSASSSEAPAAPAPEPAQEVVLPAAAVAVEPTPASAVAPAMQPEEAAAPAVAPVVAAPEAAQATPAADAAPAALEVASSLAEVVAAAAAPIETAAVALAPEDTAGSQQPEASLAPLAPEATAAVPAVPEAVTVAPEATVSAPVAPEAEAATAALEAVRAMPAVPEATASQEPPASGSTAPAPETAAPPALAAAPEAAVPPAVEPEATAALTAAPEATAAPAAAPEPSAAPAVEPEATLAPAAAPEATAAPAAELEATVVPVAAPEATAEPAAAEAAPEATAEAATPEAVAPPATVEISPEAVLPQAAVEATPEAGAVVEPAAAPEATAAAMAATEAVAAPETAVAATVAPETAAVAAPETTAAIEVAVVAAPEVAAEPVPEPAAQMAPEATVATPQAAAEAAPEASPEVAPPVAEAPAAAPLVPPPSAAVSATQEAAAETAETAAE